MLSRCYYCGCCLRCCFVVIPDSWRCWSSRANRLETNSHWIIDHESRLNTLRGSERYTRCWYRLRRVYIYSIYIYACGMYVWWSNTVTLYTPLLGLPHCTGDVEWMRLWCFKARRARIPTTKPIRQIHSPVRLVNGRNCNSKQHPIATSFAVAMATALLY